MCAFAGCDSDEVAAALQGDEKLGEGSPVPFLLHQNYPNPFNPSTRIEYEVATTMHLSLKVYTEDWQEKAVLVDRVHDLSQEPVLPATYGTQFFANDVPSGVYYYVLEGGGYTQIRAMRLVK